MYSLLTLYSSLPSQDKPFYYDSPPPSPSLTTPYPPLHPAYPISLTRQSPLPTQREPISTSNRGHKLSKLAPFTHPHKLGHHSQPDLGFPSSSTPSLDSPKRRKLNDLSSSSLRSDGFLIAPNFALIPRPLNPHESSEPFPSFLPPPPQSPLDLILLPHIQHTFSQKNHTFHLLSESTTGLIEQEGVLLSALGGVCRGLRGEGFEWRWDGDAQKERERRERREGREKLDEEKRVERERTRKLERERKEEERIEGERQREEERVKFEQEEEAKRLKEVEEEERRREQVEREEERLRKVREEALEEEAKKQKKEEEDQAEARAKEMEKEKERELLIKPEETDQQTSLNATDSNSNNVEGDVEMSDAQTQLPPIQTTTNTIGQLELQLPPAQPEVLPTLPPASPSAIDPSLSSSSTEPSQQPIQSTSSSDPQPLSVPPSSEQPSAPEPTPSAPSNEPSTPSLPLATDQVDATLSTAPSRAASQQPLEATSEQSNSIIEGTMELDPSTQGVIEQPETPVIDQEEPTVEEPEAEVEVEAEIEIEEPRRRSGRNTARTALGSRLDALGGGGGGGGGTISTGISYSPDPYSHGAITPHLQQQGEESELEPTIAQPQPLARGPVEEEQEEEEEESPLVPIEDLPEYASRLVDPESYVRSLFVSDKEVELEKCVSGPNGISGTGIMESLSSNEQEALVHDCLT